MGYRAYIGVISKREYNKIKSMNNKQFFDYCKDSKLIEEDEDNEEDYHVGPYELTKEVYGFGEPDFNPPKKTLKTFFKNSELKEKYEDYDFHFATKEFLAYTIQHYTEKIQKYYTNMITPFYKDHKTSDFLNNVKRDYSFTKETYKFDFSQITDEQQTALYKMIEHVKSFSWEWIDGMLPYNLENKDNSITSSWKFEYAVFELVRIYKTFDWKRNVLVYYGY